MKFWALFFWWFWFQGWGSPKNRNSDLKTQFLGRFSKFWPFSKQGGISESFVKKTYFFTHNRIFCTPITVFFDHFCSKSMIFISSVEVFWLFFRENLIFELGVILDPLFAPESDGSIGDLEKRPEGVEKSTFRTFIFRFLTIFDDFHDFGKYPSRHDLDPPGWKMQKCRKYEVWSKVTLNTPKLP